MMNALDVASIIVSMLVWKAPKDTWNLVNTIGYTVYDSNNIDIFIGGVHAPYAPFTNEPWHNRSKPNPNEGWINIVLNQAGEYLAGKELGVMFSDL